MTKEQTQKLWEAVNKALFDAAYAEAVMVRGSVDEWKDRVEYAQCSKATVKELLTNYTGHEVE